MEMSCQLHAPAFLSPGKHSAGTHCIGGSVGPRAGLDAVEERKIMNSGRAALVTITLTLICPSWPYPEHFTPKIPGIHLC
jgi:hypothetical protein